MRKINIFLVLLALLIIGVMVPQISSARKPAIEKTADMVKLNKILKNSVQYPDFTLNDKETSGETSVIFMLTYDGKIKILKVTAPSQRLEEFITDKLSKVVAKDMINPDGLRYRVNIRFDDN